MFTICIKNVDFFSPSLSFSLFLCLVKFNKHAAAFFIMCCFCFLLQSSLFLYHTLSLTLFLCHFHCVWLQCAAPAPDEHILPAAAPARPRAIFLCAFPASPAAWAYPVGVGQGRQGTEEQAGGRQAAGASQEHSRHKLNANVTCNGSWNLQWLPSCCRCCSPTHSPLLPACLCPAPSHCRWQPLLLLPACLCLI